MHAISRHLHLHKACPWQAAEGWCKNEHQWCKLRHHHGWTHPPMHDAQLTCSTVAGCYKDTSCCWTAGQADTAVLTGTLSGKLCTIAGAGS
jgi:hypothetical protein